MSPSDGHTLNLAPASRADFSTAQQLLLRQPAILTLDAATVAGKAAALGTALSLPVTTIRAMLVANPALLTLAPDTVRRKWLVLRAAAGSCAGWRGQLATMSPRSLATYLCLAEARIQRLHYLAAAGRQGDAPLAAALKAPDGLFAHRYAGFDGWLAARRPAALPL